jgi:hypothetical protein
MSDIRNNTRNTIKKILATPANATATPVKPRSAATNATIKKVTAQLNIEISPLKNSASLYNAAKVPFGKQL